MLTRVWFRLSSWFSIAACCAVAGVVRGQEEQAQLTTEQVQFFEAKIRPVLIEHCYRCHSVDGQSVRGGLVVDNRDAMLAGGESGPAIVPGNLKESILWDAINYRDYRMPPGGRLPANVIEDFKTWIEMGAPDPRVQVGVVVHSRVSLARISRKPSRFGRFASLNECPQIPDSTLRGCTAKSIATSPALGPIKGWYQPTTAIRRHWFEESHLT